MNRKTTISHKLRAQVALRDKFTCQECSKQGIKIRVSYGYYMAFENTFPIPARRGLLRKPIYPGDYLVSFEVDHIIPEAKGGKMVLNNLRLACRRCNRAKR